MLDVYKLMGIRKRNTTTYHPQTDGLVERFHHTLTDIIAKWAQEQIKKLQASQKLHYDASANEPNIHEGDRVYVYTPIKKSGAAYKFVRPFIGPYQVLKRYDTRVDVRLVSKPFAKPI